jgi:Ca2+-binding EF-hand superfamily protein
VTIRDAYGRVEKTCEVTVVPETVRKGDINGDGRITMTDLLMCLHHVSGRTTLTGEAFLAADINGDGAVKMTDLLRILHYVSGRNSSI